MNYEFMKGRIAVVVVLFFASVVAVCARQRMAGEAMAMLREASGNLKNADGLEVDFTMKLSVMPMVNMRLHKKNDRMALQIEDETTYFYNHIMWICNRSDRTVVVQGQRDDSEQMLALMALIPEGFSGEGRVISEDSFVIGQNVFSVCEAKDDIVLSSKNGRTKIVVVINSRTRSIKKLKVKRGMLALSFIYNDIKYSCDDDDVTFSVVGYPGYKIEDRRKVM